MAFTYDPENGNPEDQSFTVEGDGSHVVVNRSEGRRLEVDGTAKPRLFSLVDANIPSSAFLREARVAAEWLNAAEGDSGVGFEIDEGPGGKRIWVSCVQAAGEPRLRLDGSDDPPLSANWTGAEVVLLFGRTAEGDAFLEVPGTGRAEARRRNLPDAQAAAPRYAFGCFFEGPSVRGWFGRIGAPGDEDAPVADLEVTNIELQPNAAERVKVEGTFATGVDPSGVDIQKVGLTCALAGTRFYPTTADDFMPVAVRRDGEKWVITQEERDRTGIQSLELIHTGGGRFELHLNDARTNLADLDYGQVAVTLALHLDDGEKVSGTQTVALARSGQTYRGPA